MKLNLNNRAIVLWWSDRDGNGVIVDQNGLEYYVDISATPSRTHLLRNSTVAFKVNESITGCRCAVVTDIYMVDGVLV
jgi:cold shock CspA family protein